MAQNKAVSRDNTQTKTVSDEYGNSHILHINSETGGTHHKHSAKHSEHCPYCNEAKDYGMGIQL